MTGKILGYIRVSSELQNTDRQLEGIKTDKTFTDKLSGKNTDRPALNQMLEYARDGDTVIVHSMDRLARNLDNLRKIVKQLNAKQVKVKFTKEALEFTGDDSAMSNLLLSVMGAFAEFERNLRGCPRSYYPGSNLCIIRLIIDIFTQASLLNVVRS